MGVKLEQHGHPQTPPIPAIPTSPPKPLYLSRRRFLAAALAAPLAAPLGAHAATTLAGVRPSPFSTREEPTPFGAVTGYNNYYEFGTGKDEPIKLAKNFHTSPWTVSLEGEVVKPKMLDLDAVMKLAPLEERIYRHRCVEGWSFVIPLGRLSAECAAETGGTHFESKIRRVPNLL